MTFLEEIYQQFDLFLIDQFGVLHNGSTPCLDAVECLEKLKVHQKKVVIISNSSKRSEHNQKRLELLGISSHLWSDIVTSGEVAWHQLNRYQNLNQKKCLLISNDDDGTSFMGLDLSLTTSAENADYVIIAGTKPAEYSLSDYEEQLKPFALNRVPAVCTNPDFKLVTADNSDSVHTNFGPGKIASIYEELGGTVEWIGKPHKAIYNYITDQLNFCGKTLCIGDSIEHDILGAQQIGARSLFISSGLYASECEVETAMSDAGVFPDYKSNRLRWSR